MQRIIREVILEHARKLIEGEKVQIPTPVIPTAPIKPEVVLPEMPKPPEIPKIEVKPTILFEADKTEILGARKNRIFTYKDKRGTIFYFLMRSSSNDYTVYLTVDDREMIRGRTFEELEPDSTKIEWYMATYDYERGEYVFGLFKIMWERNFILIVEPASEMSVTLKYNGIII